MPRWYLRVKGSSPLLGVTIFSREKNSNPLRVNKGLGYFRVNLDSINMINIIRSKNSPPPPQRMGLRNRTPRKRRKEATTRPYYIKTDCRLVPWAVCASGVIWRICQRKKENQFNTARLFRDEFHEKLSQNTCLRIGQEFSATHFPYFAGLASFIINFKVARAIVTLGAVCHLLNMFIKKISTTSFPSPLHP